MRMTAFKKQTLEDRTKKSQSFDKETCSLTTNSTRTGDVIQTSGPKGPTNCCQTGIRLAVIEHTLLGVNHVDSIQAHLEHVESGSRNSNNSGNKCFTSSHPHPGKLCWQSFWHIIWNDMWHIQYMAFHLAFFLAYTLTFYLTCFLKRILHSIWHPCRHSIQDNFWHATWHSVWHSIWNSVWHSIWHSMSHFIWHSTWASCLALYLIYILTFYLESGILFGSFWHLFWNRVMEFRPRHAQLNLESAMSFWHSLWALGPSHLWKLHLCWKRETIGDNILEGD